MDTVKDLSEEWERDHIFVHADQQHSTSRSIWYFGCVSQNMTKQRPFLGGFYVLLV